MEFLKRMWADEKGEDLTEYALIVGLVALAVLIGAAALGGAFNTWYSSMATWVAGVAP